MDGYGSTFRQYQYALSRLSSPSYTWLVVELQRSTQQASYKGARLQRARPCLVECRISRQKLSIF